VLRYRFPFPIFFAASPDDVARRKG